MDYGHPRATDYGPSRQFPGHMPGSSIYDRWTQGRKGQLYSSGSSSPSTFEEVESLCMSRSSSESSQHKLQYRGLPRPHILGPSQGQLRQEKILSRQSSGNSLSATSGNPSDHLDRPPRPGNSGGSPFKDRHSVSADPCQRVDLMSGQAFVDSIFMRVLQWNQAYSALSAGRDASCGFPPMMSAPALLSPSHLAAGTPWAAPQDQFCSLPSGGTLPRPSSPGPPMSPRTGSQTHTAPVSPGRRMASVNKENTLSPTSDVTHVKKRRDLILPDEEDEFSFPRASSRKQETAKHGAASSQNGQTHTPSRLKQARSESMLSSMSSMSQSQDLSWREQFDHDWREAQHNAWRQQADQGFGDPYVNPWKKNNPSQNVWRDPFLFCPQQSPYPSSMTMPPAQQMHGRVLSRGMSIESMTSIGMATPSESGSQNPAEAMLMNLGFGGSAEGFLPERFLRDWCSKMSRTPGQYPVTPPPPQDNSSSIYNNRASAHKYNDLESLTPKSIYEDMRSASDLQLRIGQPYYRHGAVSPSQTSDPPETPTSLLPPSLGKESRSDRLKEYIEAYAHNMSSATDSRSARIRQFACSRQKSLPSYLETLTEEEEVKPRSSWPKPQAAECRLQAFLRDDSLSTASGTSDGQMASSGGGSNDQSLMGSESESLSGSDQVSAPYDPTSSSPPSQTESIPSRVLTLKMPTPSQRRSQLMSESKHLDHSVAGVKQSQFDLNHASDYQQQHLSNNSTGQCREGQQEHEKQTNSLHIPTSQSVHEETQKGSLSHRSRSPLLFKTKSDTDVESGWTAERKYIHQNSMDTTSNGNMLSAGIDRNLLFVSQVPLESPIRRYQNPADRQLSAFTTSNGQRKTLEFWNRHTDPVDRKLLQSGEKLSLKNNNYGVHSNSGKSDSLLSTESLEVADIFHNSSCDFTDRSSSAYEGFNMMNNDKLVEPAMVSIVLEDVDGNLMDGVDTVDGGGRLYHRHQQQCHEGLQQDDHLQVPSCSSSTSLSPIPLSPVTVIEVSLDNQHDSIDTEESFSSSKDTNDEDDDLETAEQTPQSSRDDTNSEELSDIRDVKEHSAKKELSYSEASGSNGKSMNGFCEGSSHKDGPSIIEDGGSSSPVLLFNAASPQTSSSSSPSVSYQLSEMGVQADDGRLSPLVSGIEDDFLHDLPDGADLLFPVTDQAVQCDGKELQDQPKLTSCRTCEASQQMTITRADTYCQTKPLVRFEMSSQTEQVPLYISSGNNAKLKRGIEPLDEMMPFNDISPFCKHCTISNSARTGNRLPDRIRANKACGSLGRVSKDSRKPESMVTNKTTSQTFDSEFWEYMGMEVPSKLLRSEIPRNENNKTGQHGQPANQFRDSNFTVPLQQVIQPDINGNERTKVDQLVSHESAHSTAHKNDRTCLNCSSFQTNPCSSTYKDNSEKQGRVHNQIEHVKYFSACSGCPLSHETVERGGDQHSYLSVGLHKNQNMAVTSPDPMSRRDSEENVKVIKNTDSSNMNTLSTFEQDKNVSENQKVHVSQLSFVVGDYRAKRGHSTSSSNEYNSSLANHAENKHSINISKRIWKLAEVISGPSHSSAAQPVKFLECKTTDWSVRSPPTRRHENRCSAEDHSVDGHVVNQMKDIEHDMDSGIMGSPTSSSLVSHEEEQQYLERIRKNNLHLTLLRGIPSEDGCSQSFKSVEEAREFVLSKFLLRRSAESKSGISKAIKNTPEGTYVHQHDMVSSHAPNKTVIQLSEFHPEKACLLSQQETHDRLVHKSSEEYDVSKHVIDSELDMKKNEMKGHYGVNLHVEQPSDRYSLTDEECEQYHSIAKRQAEMLHDRMHSRRALIRKKRSERVLHGNMNTVHTKQGEDAKRKDQDESINTSDNVDAFVSSVLQSACQVLCQSHTGNKKSSVDEPQVTFTQSVTEKVHQNEDTLNIPQKRAGISDTCEHLESTAQASMWYDYSFHAFSAKVNDAHSEVRNFLSQTRSQSADSLNSLRANYSESIDDILDTLDNPVETPVSQKVHASLSTDTDLSVCSQEKPSVYDKQNREYGSDIPQTHSQYHAKPLSDDSSKPLISGVNDIRPCQPVSDQTKDMNDTLPQTISASQLPIYTEKSSTYHSKSNGTNTAAGCEPLTDATLTQLILMGANHPDFQRLKEQGILRDSFESSPSFTTPDDAVNSDAEDMLVGGTVAGTSPKSAAHQQYNAEVCTLTNGQVTQHSCISCTCCCHSLNNAMSETCLKNCQHQCINYGSYDGDSIKTLELQTENIECNDKQVAVELETNSNGPKDKEQDSYMELGSQDKEASNDVNTLDFQDETFLTYSAHRSFNEDTTSHQQAYADCSHEQDKTMFTFDTQDSGGRRVLTFASPYREEHRQSPCPDRSQGTEVSLNQSTLSSLPTEQTRLSPLTLELSNLSQASGEQTTFSTEQTTLSQLTEVRTTLSKLSIDQARLSPLPFEKQSPMSLEIPSIDEAHNRSNRTSFDESYYRPISNSTSCESDHYFGNAADIESNDEAPITSARFSSPSRTHAALNEGVHKYTYTPSSSRMLEANRRQVRSQFLLSLHPMQSDVPNNPDIYIKCPALTAAEKRDAYNRVTSDRTSFGISSSFSEENLSSPPLRPRRFQRSLSKESTCSDFSPKRVKRTVSKSSPTSNKDQAYSGNSLQVPNAGESLVSKNTLSKRRRSSSGADTSVLPSCQSPILDRQAGSFSTTSSGSRPSSPCCVGTVPDVLLSPHPPSPASRAPSPIPDVTISSVNQSLELISFASSPEGSSRGNSPTENHPLQSLVHSPGKIKTTVFESRRVSPCSPYKMYNETGDPPNSPADNADTMFTLQHPERLSPYRYLESSPKTASRRVNKFRGCNNFQTISSPNGSQGQTTASIIRSHSSSGDEGGPVQIPLSCTFYSSRHTLLPHPRARLWAAGDRNSSSTESPMPFTPPLSRDHSSTSDSSSSHKDSQSTTSAPTHNSTFGSPKSPTSLPAQPASAQGVENTEPPTAPCQTSPEKLGVSEQQSTEPADMKSDMQSAFQPLPDDLETAPYEPESSNSPCAPEPSTSPGGVTSTSTFAPDPLKALHLRRSRFQRPENTISLQQASSSSDQSSFETDTSPGRRFFWASGQKTVVSTDTVSKEYFLGDSIPQAIRSTWTSGDLGRTGSGTGRKLGNPQALMSQSRDSTSSPSDHMSCEASPARTRVSGDNGLPVVIN